MRPGPVVRRWAVVALAVLLVPVGGSAAAAQVDRPVPRPAPTAPPAAQDPGFHAAATKVVEGPSEAGQRFTGVVPFRVLDTREGLGAPAAPLGGGRQLDLQVSGTGGAAGVPTTADAVAVNVTATNPTGPTYVSVWPAGGDRPVVSSLNLVAGQTRANLVQVGLSPGGKISLYNNVGSIDLVVDVVGYYDAGTDTGAGLFKGRSPERIFDSRIDNAALGSRQTIDVKVAGVAGVPVTADSVILNVTVTEPTSASYLTVWPAGQTRPTASSVNVAAGQTVPNRVIAKVGANGSVSVYNNNGGAHVVLDVGGWFTGTPEEDDGSHYRSVSPLRVADTRSGLGVPGRVVGSRETLRIPVAGLAGLPAADSSVPASAVVANITVVSPTAQSYLTAWPAGSPRPLASDLNFSAQEVVPNHAVVAVGADGAFEIYNNLGDVDVVVDVVGYFAGQVKLADDVVILTSQERAAVVVEGPDTLRVPGDAGLGRVQVGSVLVSDVTQGAPNGFLRRVTELRVDGAGQVAVTVPATLSEVIAQGAAQIDVPLTEQTGSSAPGTAELRAAATASWSQRLPFAADLTVQPKSAGGASARAGLEGAVEVSAAASMSLDVGLFSGFDFDFEARAGAALQAQLNVSAALTILSAEKQLKEVSFKHVTFMVGPVPVVLQPEFELGYKAAMEVGGQLSTTVTKSQTAVGGFSVRNFAYDDYTDSSGTPLTFDVVAGAVAVQGGVELIPSLEVELYEAGEFGVGIAMGPRAVLSTTDCTVVFSFNADVVLSFEIEILGKEFGDGVEARVRVFEQELKTIQLAECDSAWTATPGVTADQAAQEVLGNGVSLKGAAYSGSASALATYTAPFQAVPISRGLVLSSGDAAGLRGPNNDSAYTAAHGLPGDAGISALTGANSFDAASLSLTVVPSGSTLQIDFGFASEEYMEYVDNGFNDAFAIYVNGTNCATVEKTFDRVPVTVDAINGFRNQLNYVDNANGGKDTQADGLTTLLRCNAPVTPGTAVTITMVIADVGDDILDSWAYIQRGGVRSL